MTRTVGPVAINHTGQLQSITVSFNLAPGASLGQASSKIDVWRDEIHMPPSLLTGWGGDAAAFQASQSSQVWLIVSALLVIYVLLGVLYESYIHPLTIFAGLPSAAVGALLALWIFGQDLSIIATIGILMLIGIVKKNAIMMIDFALDAQREQDMTPHEAIRTACLLRFRPIMMTTFAAMFGAVAHRRGPGHGRGASPAARPRGGRRPALLAGDHALHHAGDLPLPRPLFGQGTHHQAGSRNRRSAPSAD